MSQNLYSSLPIDKQAVAHAKVYDPVMDEVLAIVDATQAEREWFSEELPYNGHHQDGESAEMLDIAYNERG